MPALLLLLLLYLNCALFFPNWRDAHLSRLCQQVNRARLANSGEDDGTSPPSQIPGRTMSLGFRDGIMKFAMESHSFSAYVGLARGVPKMLPARIV
jgi:hypothetical protein